MKKIKFTIFCLILISLFSACSMMGTMKEPTYRTKLLKQEIQRWKSFQAEGTVEINYQMFAFRKNFILSKNTEALRLDMFDTGLFGLGNTNISLYADSSLTITGFIGKRSLNMSLDKQYYNVFQWINQTETDSLIKQYDQIIRAKMIAYQGWDITLDSDMRIIKAENADLKANIVFLYDFNNTLSSVEIRISGSKIANFRIDKIAYENITVTKLKR